MLLCCLAASAVQAVTSDEVRGIYDEHLLKLTLAQSERVRTWQDAYHQALTELADKTRGAGDLEGWKLIKAEADRFQATQALGREHLVTQPAALRSAQVAFRRRWSTETVEHDRAVVALTDKCAARLEAEQRRLTIEGSVDQALAFNAELKRLREHPRVTAALFELALVESEAAAGATAAVPAVASAVAATPGAEGAPTAREAVAAADKQDYASVYAGGMRPPSLATSVRKETLYPTTTAAMARRVSLSVWMTKGRTEGGECAFRVELRNTQQGDPLGDLRVCIDYFTKPRKDRESGSSGRIEARRANTHTATIARLDANPVTVDFAKANASDEDQGWEWQDVYGTVVTVFNKAGTILAQTTTTPGLKEKGREKPEPPRPPKIDWAAREEAEREARRLAHAERRAEKRPATTPQPDAPTLDEPTPDKATHKPAAETPEENAEPQPEATPEPMLDTPPAAKPPAPLPDGQ